MSEITCNGSYGGGGGGGGIIDNLNSNDYWASNFFAIFNVSETRHLTISSDPFHSHNLALCLHSHPPTLFKPSTFKAFK